MTPAPQEKQRAAEGAREVVIETGMTARALSERMGVRVVRHPLPVPSLSESFRVFPKLSESF